MIHTSLPRVPVDEVTKCKRFMIQVRSLKKTRRTAVVVEVHDGIVRYGLQDPLGEERFRTDTISSFIDAIVTPMDPLTREECLQKRYPLEFAAD
jgi:hypothetical protein